MLARSVPARAIAQHRLRAAGAVSARHISMARSAVALGKRPALPAASGMGPSLVSVASARGISFWGKSSQPAAQTATGDVPAVPAQPPIGIDTPLPSSDIPASPAEHALPAADHLTSTAPDHHFHSDPTPLLPQYPANAETPTLEDLITNSGLPLEQVLNSPEAVHAAMKVSDLNLMGLSHSFINPAGWMRDALVGMHEMTGLPWWASIVAMTVAMRSCLIPLVIRGLKHNLRMAAVSEQFGGLMKRVTEAKTQQDPVAQQVALANLQTLMKKHNVSPFGALWTPLISVPFFLSMFYALRKFATLPLPQLKEGGFGWVTDLTAPDPLFILPITSVSLQLLTFYVGVDGTGHGKAESTRTMAHFRNAMVVMSPLLMLMFSQFPAAVLFYWTTANVFTLTQAFLLRQPFVRRMIGAVEPPKVAAPPGETPINTNPSLYETYKAAMEWQSKAMEKARARSAEISRLAEEREKQTSARAGTGMMASRIREPETKGGGFLEAATSDEPAAPDAAATSADPKTLRRRRLESAREKRERQKRS